MRRWLILATVLLAVGAVAIALATARLNGYLAAHRDELATWASQVLGRPVAFDAIGVSVRGGGSTRITGLRVADDPRFGDGPFLQAQSAVVSISLLDAVRGELRVRSVVIDAPRLHLDRDAAGWNIDSLAPLQAPGEAPPAGVEAATTTPAAPPQRAAAAARPFWIESLSLRDGLVTVSDRSRQPPTTLTVDRVDLTLSQPAANAPLQVEGAAALFAAAVPNATISGSLTAGTPPTADIQLGWDAVPLTALRPLVPAIGEYDISGEVGGALRFAGPLSAVGGARLASLLPALSGTVEVRGLGVAMRAAPVRVTDLSGALRFAPDAIELAETSARIGDAPVLVACRMVPPAAGTAQCRLTAAAIDLDSLSAGDGVLHEVAVEASLAPFDPAPLVHATLRVGDGRLGDAAFRQLEATATMQGDTAEVTRASLSAFGGTVQASGRCAGATGPAPACSVATTLQGTRLASLLSALRSRGANRIDGRLDAELRLSTTGGDVAALRRSTTGAGSVRVSGGVIHGLNLAQGVLGGAPGIDAARRSGGRASALLGSSDTRFARLTAAVRIADEHVSSSDLALEAEDFSVQASGRAGFAGDLSVRGTFRGSAPLLADLGRGVPGLGRLAASTQGIIAIPFTVRGTVADPRIEPDLTALASDVGRQVGAGLEALLAAPDPKRGTPGGVLRQGLDKLFGR